MRHAIRLVLVVVGLLLSAHSATAATLTCSTATTLDALATCIKNQIPGNGSGEWVAATATEQAAWRSAVSQMLAGACNFTLPSAIASAAQIRTFTDTSTSKSYCLLMEVLDGNNNGKVDRGWGAFMVNPNATLEISHQAPHPLADLNTENESIGVFGGTNSRSWLMTGAHRLAASGANSCQSSYGAADAAHNVTNMFHATNIELLAFYGNNLQTIQWHAWRPTRARPTLSCLTDAMSILPPATRTCCSETACWRRIQPGTLRRPTARAPSTRLITYKGA